MSRLLACALAIPAMLAAPGGAQEEPALDVPRAGSLDLRALADEIDPGEVPGLRHLVPTAVRERLDTELNAATAEERVARLRVLVSGLRAQGISWDGLYSLILFSDAVSQLWRQRPDDELALSLQPIYSKMGGWWLGSGLDVALAALEWLRQGATIDTWRAMRPELDAHVEAMYRSVAAHVLRSPGCASCVGQALAGLGGLATAAGDHERAVRLREESVRRLGNDSPGAWIALARGYFRVLDFARGDAALEHARRILEQASDESTRRDLASLDEARAVYRRIGDLLGASELGERLLAAELLISRHQEWARVLFEELAVAHPEDARPRIGLARCAAVALDSKQASRELEEARRLQHHDLHFREIDTMVQFWRLVDRVLRRAGQDWDKSPAPVRVVLRAVRDGAVQMQASGHEDAVAWQAVIDIGLELLEVGADEERLRAALRKLLPRALALQREHPGSLAAYQLVLASAPFAEETSGALEILRQPPPPFHAKQETDVERARVWLALAVLERAPQRLEELAGIIAAITSRPEQQPALRGVVHAISARTRGDRDAWASAEADLRQAIEKAPAAQLVQLESNLAVALAEQGRTAEALEALERSAQHDSKTAAFSIYNRSIVELRSGRAAADIEATLESLPEGAGSPWMAARVWAGHLARQDGRAEDAARLFGQVVDKAASDRLTRPDFGADGVVFDETSQWALNYVGDPPRLQLHFATPLHAWLIFPPPLSLDEVRAAAGR